MLPTRQDPQTHPDRKTLWSSITWFWWLVRATILGTIIVIFPLVLGLVLVMALIPPARISPLWDLLQQWESVVIIGLVVMSTQFPARIILSRWSVTAPKLRAKKYGTGLQGISNCLREQFHDRTWVKENFQAALLTMLADIVFVAFAGILRKVSYDKLHTQAPDGTRTTLQNGSQAFLGGVAYLIMTFKSTPGEDKNKYRDDLSPDELALYEEKPYNDWLLRLMEWKPVAFILRYPVRALAHIRVFLGATLASLVIVVGGTAALWFGVGGGHNLPWWQSAILFVLQATLLGVADFAFGNLAEVLRYRKRERRWPWQSYAGGNDWAKFSVVFVQNGLINLGFKFGFGFVATAVQQWLLGLGLPRNEAEMWYFLVLQFLGNFLNVALTVRSLRLLRETTRNDLFAKYGKQLGTSLSVLPSTQPVGQPALPSPQPTSRSDQQVAEQLNEILALPERIKELAEALALEAMTASQERSDALGKADQERAALDLSSIYEQQADLALPDLASLHRDPQQIEDVEDRLTAYLREHFAALKQHLTEAREAEGRIDTRQAHLEATIAELSGHLRPTGQAEAQPDGQ